MAKNGFRVMDSDMHLMEPGDLWERYIDPAYKERAPKCNSREPRDFPKVHHFTTNLLKN